LEENLENYAIVSGGSYNKVSGDLFLKKYGKDVAESTFLQRKRVIQTLLQIKTGKTTLRLDKPPSNLKLKKDKKVLSSTETVEFLEYMRLQVELDQFQHGHFCGLVGLTFTATSAIEFFSLKKTKYSFCRNTSR
jgi:hypothetical protein